MNTQLFVVYAISAKPEKEFGWVRVIPASERSVWGDVDGGAHFDKKLLSELTGPGLYMLAITNQAQGFGEFPKYFVQSAKRVSLFSEIAQKVGAAKA